MKHQGFSLQLMVKGVHVRVDFWPEGGVQWSVLDPVRGALIPTDEEERTLGEEVKRLVSRCCEHGLAWAGPGSQTEDPGMIPSVAEISTNSDEFLEREYPGCGDYVRYVRGGGPGL